MQIKFRPYQKRKITFQRLVSKNDWTLKLYQITCNETEIITPECEKAATAAAFDFIATPRSAHVAAGIDWSAIDNYKLGSLIIHKGADAVFALLDYWAGENMIVHQTWVAPINSPEKFDNISESGLCLCVWELAVVQHEREAWIKHIYNAECLPNINDFLADTLTTSV